MLTTCWLDLDGGTKLLKMSDQEAAERFGAVAEQFCRSVEASPRMQREQFLLGMHRLLPLLIHEAASLPDVPVDYTSDEKPKIRMTSEDWQSLYYSLQEMLGDWNQYRQVFDPINDSEVVIGTLSDDFGDIYRDLKEGLGIIRTDSTKTADAIWEWRFSFLSHWGKHALDALQAIHSRIYDLTLR